ncbi:unnamed protein product (macronuclear) [Paramecium tetraurelia]|uniref:Ubiquitin-like domain-containing protein n=1 Tax=Paramecium tetraurelia TaxID=5888 RepID=A0ECQ1_PARTE|nr:uncharacterized protein GSPATT00003937001 [Paramecium tetraurelia]CAK93068.1 unnamed protein product [Paramecium tetraurelia]|eukprot:XP_001460465.1 hypothetical protein (macronuclear) [Paramecium tetraurelia strain d4-2]
MENINIIISSLSGEKLKQQVPVQTKIIDIKAIIAERKGLPIQAIILKFNAKDLDDQKTIQECNIRNGDSIILMKKIVTQKLSNTQDLKASQIQKNEEQYKELLDFGYTEKDVIDALKKTNNNYQEALIILSNKSTENIEEEIQFKIPTQKEQYQALLSEQIVHELRERVSNEHEWNRTIETIQQQNLQLSVLIQQNQDQFRHLQQQHVIKNIINIEDEDLKMLIQLRDFKRNLDDKTILKIYLQNDRDLFSTMQELENLQE